MSESHSYAYATEDLRRNAGQWAAYQSRGHCVVLAGPGSGKTKTLTTKMARLLAEEIQAPRGIACITFNNECVRELESRLGALNVKSGGRVFVGTVHSFSLTQVLLPYAKLARLGLPEDFSVATRLEGETAFSTALRRVVGNGANSQDWNFRMTNYRRTILNRNSSEWRETHPQLAQLVEVYEEELRRDGLIDFDDMPLLALRALRENSWIQRALLAKYPVLVVDEYQDLGRALHQIVLRLCFAGGLRLFAVGDPDQSIYGFTGARPDLLRRLSEREDVETIQLRLNYRSGSNIVAASGFALGEDRGYEAVKGTPPGEVFFHPLSGRYEQQANYLIRGLLAEAMARQPDLRYGDVAVLYPAAWIGDAVALAANQMGIPILRTDGNALYPRSSRLLRWLEQCARWCCGGWKAGNPRFSLVSNEGHRLFSEVLRTEEEVAGFRRRLMELLWGKRDARLPLYQWLIEIDDLITEDLIDGCPSLRDEFDIFKNFVNRVSPEGDNSQMTLGQLAGQGDGRESITLSTLHSSKGREFSVVFMFGIDIGRLPRNDVSQQQFAEARRLFYVGFTRAKSEIHLIYSTNAVSPFVDEVKKRLNSEGF